MLWQNDPATGIFSGIKTGVTPTAGPCLAVGFKSRCGIYDFIVVVMNCKTREARFIEIPKLVRWAVNRISKVKRMIVVSINRLLSTIKVQQGLDSSRNQIKINGS